MDRLIRTMKYCKTTTQAHSLYRSFSSCHINLCDIIAKEGGQGWFFSNEEVLILDAIEELLAKREKRNQRYTMDIAFGCSVQNAKNGKITKRCMRLVEFKYKVTKVNNFKKADFEDKVNGSIDILGRDIPIDREYYFVFKKEFDAQARNHIARLFNHKTIYKAIADDKLLEMM